MSLSNGDLLSHLS